MRQRLIILGLLICSVGCIGGLWMGTTLTLAAPLENLPDQTPQAICGGTEDMRVFFKSMGFDRDFRVIATLHDEVLERRYYRVKIEPALVAPLRQQLASAWVAGHFNRAIYENGVMSRVKRSHNLPKWWNLSDPPAADHLMLDHGGWPNWYVVFTDAGDLCFMWVGH